MVRSLDPDKKASFLEAALKLFVTNGVQNTSTAEIAKEAGTAAGTLFLYFPTKKALINELILNIGRAVAGTINVHLQADFDARQMMFSIWHSSLRWFIDNPDAYHYVQQVRDSSQIEAEVVAESNRFFEFYYRAIQKGLAEDCIKAYPADLIGSFLYQDIVAVMTILPTTADPTQQEETIRLGFEIFWDGIKK